MQGVLALEIPNTTQDVIHWFCPKIRFSLATQEVDTHSVPNVLQIRNKALLMRSEIGLGTGKPEMFSA